MAQSTHTKRSHAFYMQMLGLAQRLMGVHDKADLKMAAKLLIEQSTDSQCMVNARELEPVFVLRAKDPVAAETLAFWIEQSSKRGLHQDKLSDAGDCLKDFLGYKAD